MKYSDLQQNTPRVVVMYRSGPNGEDRFEWGTVGALPLLTLIGTINRVQAELPLLEPGDSRYDCPEPALAIVWDDSTKSTAWFVHPSIPADPLSGMLETIKSALLQTQMAQRAAAQKVGLIGPNGQPLRR